jgi:hypothetical protein
VLINKKENSRFIDAYEAPNDAATPAPKQGTDVNTHVSNRSPAHHPLSTQSTLQSDPRNRNHNIHALLYGALPLVAVCAILLVVPVRANGAVHAAATVLLGF